MRTYAAALPHAQLVTLSGCGHYPWVEQPGQFRDVLRPWLAAG